MCQYFFNYLVLFLRNCVRKKLKIKNYNKLKTMNTNCIRSSCFESNYRNYASDFHIWRVSSLYKSSSNTSQSVKTVVCLSC